MKGGVVMKGYYENYVLSLVYIRGDRVLLVEHDPETVDEVELLEEALLPSSLFREEERFRDGRFDVGRAVKRSFLHETGIVAKHFHDIVPLFIHASGAHRFVRITHTNRSKMNPNCEWHPIVDVLDDHVPMNYYHTEVIRKVVIDEGLHMRYPHIAAAIALPPPRIRARQRT